MIFLKTDTAAFTQSPTIHTIVLALIASSGITLIALQMVFVGWVLLFSCAVTLLFTEKRFSRDMSLLMTALAILGFTPINTGISIHHMTVMGLTLVLAVAVPYAVSRFVFRDFSVRFSWHHRRDWYRSEMLYIGIAALSSFLLLPFYLKSTGAYMNWPSALDSGSIVRLFIGTNALGIWDELFFVCTVLSIARRYTSFLLANIFQAVLFTSFLYELGFTSWGFIMIFIFALTQGYIFQKTESLLYVITIHLTVDIILFLALIHTHHFIPVGH